MRRAHAAVAPRRSRCCAASVSAGFAEYVITPVSGAIKVPDDTPLEVVCVIGCAVQTGVGAVLNTARVPEGATVLVVGAGGIGIAIVQGARIAGATRIIVSDPVGERRETAMRFGATDVIDPTAEDVVARVHGAHQRDRCRRRVRRGRFDGRDRDVHLVDAQRRHDGARRCRRPRSVAEPVAAGADDASTSARSWARASVAATAAATSRASIALWRAGRLDLEGMITARRPLGEINEAMADMTAGLGLRTVLTI